MNNPVLALARGKFDVGLLTAHGDAALEFWGGTLGLERVKTIEPVPGVLQHRFDLWGAVLKVNRMPAPQASPRRSGLRLLTLTSDKVEEPTHLVDPDGNLVHLVPPTSGLASFDLHLAVSDETEFDVFFGETLGLPRIGPRTFEMDGASVSFSWSPDVHPGLSTGPLGYAYLTIQVLDAVEAHRTLCDRGARELAPPSGDSFASDSVVSFITDPDGNRIEISQRPDLVARHRP